MKRIDLNEVREASANKDAARATLMALIEQQIGALEKLLESNAHLVENHTSWNVVAGYIDQLRWWAPRPFLGADDATLAKDVEGIPPHPLVGLGE